LNNQLKRFIGRHQRISVRLQRIFVYLNFVFNKYDYKRVIGATITSRFYSASTDKTINKFFELTNKRNAEWLSLQYELSKLNYVV
jgi:hypothetical protein